MDFEGITPSVGDVFWVDFNPVVGSEQGERRPCVIVSPDALNHVERNPIVTVLPITSKGHASPLRMPVSGQVKGFALINQVRSIDKTRLARLSGSVTDDELTKILATLRNFFS